MVNGMNETTKKKLNSDLLFFEQWNMWIYFQATKVVWGFSSRYYLVWFLTPGEHQTPRFESLHSSGAASPHQPLVTNAPCGLWDKFLLAAVASNIADFPVKFPYLLLCYCKSHGFFKRHKHPPVPLSIFVLFYIQIGLSDKGINFICSLWIPHTTLGVSPFQTQRRWGGHNECFLLAGFQKLLI